MKMICSGVDVNGWTVAWSDDSSTVCVKVRRKSQWHGQQWAESVKCEEEYEFGSTWIVCCFTLLHCNIASHQIAWCSCEHRTIM